MCCVGVVKSLRLQRPDRDYIFIGLPLKTVTLYLSAPGIIEGVEALLVSGMRAAALSGLRGSPLSFGVAPHL